MVQSFQFLMGTGIHETERLRFAFTPPKRKRVFVFWKVVVRGGVDSS
jgi:hypothetical protein